MSTISDLYPTHSASILNYNIHPEPHPVRLPMAMNRRTQWCIMRVSTDLDPVNPAVVPAPPPYDDDTDSVLPPLSEP